MPFAVLWAAIAAMSVVAGLTSRAAAMASDRAFDEALLEARTVKRMEEYAKLKPKTAEAKKEE